MTTDKLDDGKEMLWDYCPTCAGELDTGFECNSCGRDWRQWAMVEALEKDRISEMERESGLVTDLEQTIESQAAELERLRDSFNHCDGVVHCRTCADVQGADL